MSGRQPRGRPRAEDIPTIEARLIREASKLFFAKGYGHTTMSAVAAAARASKATLYARFPSKADLFRAVVAQHTADWGSGLHKTRIDPEAGLRDLLLTYGDMAIRAGTSAEFIHINRLLYSESGRFPELGAVAEARLELGIGYLAGEISRRAPRENQPCEDPRSTAVFFLTLLAGWLGNAILTNRLPDAQERSDWLYGIVDLVLGECAEP